MGLSPRDTQTQVKHLILEKYLDTWGGIIIHGLRNYQQSLPAQSRSIHLVYVDGFAGCGRYTEDRSELTTQPQPGPIFGSPIIGIRALDKLRATFETRYELSISVNAILVEREPQHFILLQESLKLAGLESRVCQTERFGTLQNGEIALCKADFCDLAQAVRSYTSNGKKFAFYLLDPYGPSGIPLDQVVAPIIRLKRTDVMINFPYQDLHRKTGFLNSSRLAAKHQTLVEHHDAMFGSPGWQQVYEQAAPEKVENALVDYYDQVLRQTDTLLNVKSVRLRFPDKERTMFYLFLTTHDPTGALKLNEILDNAKLREFELRQRYRIAREFEQAADRGQLPLLPFDELTSIVQLQPAMAAFRNAPDIAALATEIQQQFAGQQVEFRSILGFLADSPYYHQDIHDALKQLKRKGQVNYDSKGQLRNSDWVNFA